MWPILLPSVGVPLVAVVVMTAMEALARPTPFWEKMTDVGWDLCILGVGVTGGIFTNPLVEQVYGAAGALLAAIFVILVNLGLGVSVLHLKKAINPADRRTGSVCILLGCLAVGLPSGLTFWR